MEEQINQQTRGLVELDKIRLFYLDIEKTFHNYEKRWNRHLDYVRECDKEGKKPIVDSVEKEIIYAYYNSFNIVLGKLLSYFPDLRREE